MVGGLARDHFESEISTSEMFARHKSQCAVVDFKSGHKIVLS